VCAVLALSYSRRKLGLSQKRLADLVGSDQPTISNFETGRRLPSDKMLAKLADVLGVWPAYTLLRPVVVQVPEADGERGAA
jgi:transcriptional regulator with XRE-family HTH domain